MKLKLVLACASVMLLSMTNLRAQELNAKVSINRQQVSNTKSGVFEALEKAMTQFLNERNATDKTSLVGLFRFDVVRRYGLYARMRVAGVNKRQRLGV